MEDPAGLLRLSSTIALVLHNLHNCQALVQVLVQAQVQVQALAQAQVQAQAQAQVQAQAQGEGGGFRMVLRVVCVKVKVEGRCGACSLAGAPSPSVSHSLKRSMTRPALATSAWRNCSPTGTPDSSSMSKSPSSEPFDGGGGGGLSICQLNRNTEIFNHCVSKAFCCPYS